jgi:hypothetical protein
MEFAVVRCRANADGGLSPGWHKGQPDAKIIEKVPTTGDGKRELTYLADCCATVRSVYLLEQQPLEATKLAAQRLQALADATPDSVAGRHMNSRLGWGVHDSVVTFSG